MSNVIEETIDLLGKKVKDKVTGVKGHVTSVSFDLYGCIQAVVTPKPKTGDEPRWYDVARLDVTSDKRVMAPPQEWTMDKGPAEKPERSGEL